MTKPHTVHQHAQRIAKRLAKDLAPQIGEDLRFLLQQHPEWVMDSLKGLVEAKPPDESGTHWLQEAYSLLLGQQLELLRYGVDRGQPTAIDLAHQFQHRVVGLAQHGLIPTLLLTRIAVLLRDAKLPPVPELFKTAAALMSDATPPESFSLEDLPQLLRELAQDIGDDPFEIAKAITELTYAMPPEALAMMAELILSQIRDGLEDIVPLMLLDDRPKARQALAHVIQNHAKTFTSISLRRLIALRNWLPQADRPLIDETIKLARRHGVACAAWPEPVVGEIYASALDGSGAQGFFFLSRAGRKHTVSSILTRLGKGILDAWTAPDLSRRDLETMMSQVCRCH